MSDSNLFNTFFRICIVRSDSNQNNASSDKDQRHSSKTVFCKSRKRFCKREILTELKETFVDDDFQGLEQVIGITEKKENEMVKKRQVKKYNALVKEKEDYTKERTLKFEDQEKMKKDKIKDEVVDLTKNGIDDDKKDQTFVKHLKSSV